MISLLLGVETDQKSTYVKGKEAEPQNNGTERGQSHVVTWDINGNLLALIIQNEFARSGTQEVRRRSGRDPSDHVDCSASGKVVDFAIQEAARVPDPVRADRVDETTQSERVHQVRPELAPFGDGPAHNGGRGPSKDVVEIPVDVINAADVVGW